jgi:hypothetical protein
MKYRPQPISIPCSKALNTISESVTALKIEVSFFVAKYQGG